MIVMPPVFHAGDTVYLYFDTYDSAGASVTITGLAVTDIEVYKNGSVTQRASDNGYALLDTDGIDFDGAVGLHGFSIDTADNSDASFWANGAQYLVHVNAITVDLQTVRFSYLLVLPADAGAARPEPTGVPGATITALEKIDWLFMALRNRLDINSTTGKKIFYDDGGAAEWEKDISDDGSVYTETEANAP